MGNSGLTMPPSRVDENLTNLAVELRNLMQKISNFSTQVNGHGDGLGYLEGIGYPNADDALLKLAYMDSLAQIYNGLLQQGGTGGTGASTFDFNNALSPLWNGQLNS